MNDTNITHIFSLVLCLDNYNCWDNNPKTLNQTVGASWAAIYQLIFGILLYASPYVFEHLCPSLMISRLGITGFMIHFIFAIYDWLKNSIISLWNLKYPPKFIIKTETHNHKKFVNAYKKASVFFSHIRSENNFLRSNTESHSCPPNAIVPCRERMTVKDWSPFRVLGMGTTFDYSMGLAIISGSLGSLIIVLHNYAKYTETMGDEGNMFIYIEGIKVVASELINNFKFFPVFLLFGYLSYSVTLWRRFVEQGTFIQGRLHDICIMVGGSVIDPNNNDTRRLLYRIYRYVTVAHFLCYSSLNEKLSNKKMSDLIQLGLLTNDEVIILDASYNKARDTLCGWISLEVQEALRNGNLDTTANAPLIHSVARFRGYMGALHDLFDLSNPNMWASNMMLVVNTNIIIIAMGLPWILHIDSTTMVVPWINILGVCISSLCYWTTTKMIIKLENCYEGEDDIINPDTFLAGSEQTAFALLRVSFDKTFRKDKLYTGSMSILI